MKDSIVECLCNLLPSENMQAAISAAMALHKLTSQETVLPSKMLDRVMAVRRTQHGLLAGTYWRHNLSCICVQQCLDMVLRDTTTAVDDLQVKQILGAQHKNSDGQNERKLHMLRRLQRLIIMSMVNLGQQGESRVIAELLRLCKVSLRDQ